METKEKIEEKKYSVDTLCKMFPDNVDALRSILQSDQYYTKNEANQKLSNFYKKEIK